MESASGYLASFEDFVGNGMTLNSIRKAAKESRIVLTTSSTCTFTMRDEYEHLLDIKVDDVKVHVELVVRTIRLSFAALRIELMFTSPCLRA